MLEYNQKKGILYAYKKADARPSLIPNEGQSNMVYESFKEYKDNQCKDDIMNIFMPAFLKATKGFDKISTDKSRIEIKQVGAGYWNDMTYHVEVRFNLAGFDNSQAEGVSVIKLPCVHENGVIEYDSKQYAFIHMLEQEANISFEDNVGTSKPQELRLKNDARSIAIVDNPSSKLKISLSDISNTTGSRRYPLINLIFAMAANENFDRKTLWEEYANFNIINMFKDEIDLRQSMAFFGKSQGTISNNDYEKDIIPRLTLTRIRADGAGDESYDNSAIRAGLNEMLSLDRAIGEELARDVVSVLNPDKVLFKAGTIIDMSMIQVMQSEGVYVIYVKCIPNTAGYFLQEDIISTKAPAGLKITNEIRDCFPESESGMYLSKDYNALEKPIMFAAGEAITSDMINTIADIGYDSILISDKKSGGRVKKLFFYEEIMSNRQVKGYIIGQPNNDWYYLNSNKNWVTTNGIYTTYDFAALLSFCTKLFDGKWVERVVNLDDGFRKRLVPLNVQYHRAFEHAVKEGMQQMNRKLKNILQDHNGVKYLKRDEVDNEFYVFEKYFWEYLRDTAKCIHILTNDSLHNPIAYQSALTKVNVYTANSHSVSDSQRGIAIGSYGRIDPFEIPQSQKLGVVYNQTCGVKVDKNGTLRTAYHRIIRESDNRYKLVRDKVQLMTVAEEEKYVIGDIGSLEYDSDGYITNLDDIVTCRVPSVNDIEKHTFRGRRVRDIEYVNVDATQSLSWTSACIPFMSSNDSARVIFADSQLKQAKGLIEPEEPDVMTSAYEQYAWLNNTFCVIATEHGFIVDNDRQNGATKAKAGDSTHARLTYDNKLLVTVAYDGQDGITDGTRYLVPEYFNSGTSVTKNYICVKPGQEVNKGDILIASNFISKNGILTIGVNALTGYICDGYNYEDGVHISKTLCDKLASYRINHEELTGDGRYSRNFMVEQEPRDWWYGSDKLSEIKVTYRDTQRGETMHRGIVPKETYGFFEKSEPQIAKDGKSIYGVDFQCVSIDPFSQGDKLSNRHGNKGVASKIEDPYNMPRLKNGMPLELTHNPLGVGSRMNIGQVMDIHCGLVAHVLGIKISTDAYNSISQDELHMLLSLTVDLMNSTGDINGILSSYDIPENFRQHCRENISNIRRYAGCFDKDGTTSVMLPGNDGKLTETKILVGYIYVFKLIQESHEKVHARGGATQGEVYSRIYDAPTHGKARGGGQRFGTMEISALAAMGASNAIHEIVNERCDNSIARNNFIVEHYLPKGIRDQYYIKDANGNLAKGQRRSVTEFLYHMLSLGIMPECTEGEFLPLSKYNGQELSYWKTSTLQSAKLPRKNSNSNVQTTASNNQAVDQKRQNLQNARDLILGAKRNGGSTGN